MDANTLGALKADIEAFDIAAKSENPSPDLIYYRESRSLCSHFDYDGMLCDGCPVKAKTGKPDCLDTPHDVLISAYWGFLELPGCPPVSNEDYAAAIQAYADFLRSLLPAEGADA